MRRATASAAAGELPVVVVVFMRSLEWRYPKIDGLSWKSPLKWMVSGVAPFMETHESRMFSVLLRLKSEGLQEQHVNMWRAGQTTRPRNFDSVCGMDSASQEKPSWN